LKKNYTFGNIYVDNVKLSRLCQARLFYYTEKDDMVMRKLLLILLAGAMLTASGCASTLMQPMAPDSLPQTLPDNEAMVVFLRPSFFGGAIQAPVAEVRDGLLMPVGIVSYGDKVLLTTEPGRHLFLVSGEAGYLLEANLEGGKVYYVYVTPYIGFMQARFKLEPVTPEQMQGQAFQKDLSQCQWRTAKPEIEQWFADNLPELNRKYANALEEYHNTPPQERLVIEPQYGSSVFLP
jgi:hypothetical protein